MKNPNPRTPVMAAGLTDHGWKVEEIVGLLDIPTISSVGSSPT